MSDFLLRQSATPPRPNVWEVITQWRVPYANEEQLSGGDVVVTHEFGDQRTPNGATPHIVLRAVTVIDRLHKPLICQFPGDEVAVERYGIVPAAVIRVHQTPGKYLDTEEVNRQVAEICRRNGWESAILCTHPDHIWRAGKNLERHGIRVIYGPVYDLGYYYSPRRFIRHQWLFVPRELLVRIMYYWKGWL